jgi:hypothetical protein
MNTINFGGNDFQNKCKSLHKYTISQHLTPPIIKMTMPDITTYNGTVYKGKTTYNGIELTEEEIKKYRLN